MQKYLEIEICYTGFDILSYVFFGRPSTIERCKKRPTVRPNECRYWRKKFRAITAKNMGDDATQKQFLYLFEEGPYQHGKLIDSDAAAG